MSASRRSASSPLGGDGGARPGPSSAAAAPPAPGRDGQRRRREDEGDHRDDVGGEVEARAPGRASTSSPYWATSASLISALLLPSAIRRATKALSRCACGDSASSSRVPQTGHITSSSMSARRHRAAAAGRRWRQRGRSAAGPGRRPAAAPHVPASIGGRNCSWRMRRRRGGPIDRQPPLGVDQVVLRHAGRAEGFAALGADRAQLGVGGRIRAGRRARPRCCPGR